MGNRQCINKLSRLYQPDKANSCAILQRVRKNLPKCMLFVPVFLKMLKKNGKFVVTCCLNGYVVDRRFDSGRHGQFLGDIATQD
jgi:hypothetical protein